MHTAKLNRAKLLIFVMLFAITCIFPLINSVNSFADVAGSIEVKVGEQKKLDAVLTLIKSQNLDSSAKTTWKSSDTKIVTVSSSGIVTGVSQGNATVTATTVYGTQTFVATANIISKSTVTGVSIDRSTVSMAVGQDVTINATVQPSSAFLKTVAWSSSDIKIATVSSAGKVTGVGAGTAIITAKTKDGGKTAACTVKVTSMVTGVTLDKTSITLLEGDKYTLQETVSPAGAYQTGVTWSTSNSSVATVLNGTVTAKAAGTCNIIAKTKDGGLTASCIVNVTAKARIAVTSVSITNKFSKIYVGEEKPFFYKITPENATNTKAIITISDKTVASYSLNSKKIKGLAPGCVTVDVETDDGKFHDSMTVDVVSSVTGINLEKSSVNMYIGEEVKLTANVIPEDAILKTVTWSSNNSAVATVSSNGTVKGISKGNAIITARSVDGGFEKTASVTVNNMVTGVQIKGSTIELCIFASYTPTITITPANAYEKGVKYQITDTGIATVDAKGVIKGVKEGTTQLIVITKDGGFVATCNVKVVPNASGINIYDQAGNLVSSSGSLPQPSPAPETAPPVTTPPAAAPASAKAFPTTSTVYIDGKKVDFEAYNINSNNYFKLRDIAMALTDTVKKFEVSWNQQRQAIDMHPGTAYTPVGNELAVNPNATEKQAVLTKSNIYMDNVLTPFTAYNLNGNNYFKLRDIGRTFGFKVFWDGAANAIYIETDQPYTDN